MKKIIVAITAFLLIGMANAQVLKLEDAISTALANNHEVIMSKYQNEANKTDVHIGAAGLLPSLDGTVGGSYNLANSNLEFANNAFPAIEGQEASQSNTQAGLKLSYMIFNGGARIRSYAKLKASGKLSELQTKISLESTVVQVVNSYYEVVRLQNQMDLLKNSLVISKDRWDRVKTNYSYGNAGKIDVLNAQVDFNNDSSSIVNTSLNLQKAKNELNFLLGRKIATEFEVEDKVELPTVKTADEYISAAKQNNTTLILSQVQLDMAELDKKINRGNLMPTISSSLDYGYNSSQNDVGVVQKSSSLGYTAGISLSWNLFDGLKKQNALEKAEILIQKGNIKEQQTLLNIEKEVQNYYDALKVNLQLLQLEQSNYEVAQLNLKRSQELLTNGSITSVQFRQAQINLLQIENKINNYKYMVKVYEYQLLRMTNQLVQ